MILTENNIKNICDIAKEAGDITLKYYNQHIGETAISIKSDDSPVTEADSQANRFIIDNLKTLFPEIALVSEENTPEDNLDASKHKKFFIIDPLDGTSGFIKKSDEFSVNIALAEDGIVKFGAIYMPVHDIMYFTDHNDKSCKISDYSKKAPKLELIKTSSNKSSDITVICTKRDPEKSEIIAELESNNTSIKKLLHISSSYKFCLIAEGVADFYPRRANIKAWDIAAGHAIIKSAGGSITDLSQNELMYKFDNGFDMPFFNAN